MSFCDHVVQIWWSESLMKSGYNRFWKSRNFEEVKSLLVSLLSEASDPTSLDVAATQMCCSYVLEKWIYQPLYHFSYEYHGKNWTHCLVLPLREIFKISLTSWSPRKISMKGHCKALCLARHAINETLTIYET